MPCDLFVPFPFSCDLFCVGSPTSISIIIHRPDGASPWLVVFFLIRFSFMGATFFVEACYDRMACLESIDLIPPLQIFKSSLHILHS